MLRGITRTAVVLCSSAAVVGFALLAIADQGDRVPIETLPGEIGLSLFIFGLLAPFGFWSTHLAVDQWVDEAGDFGAAHDSGRVAAAASAAYGLLALGLFAFAFVPFLAFAPDDVDLWAEILLLMLGSISASVLVGAVVGGVILFGWRGAVVGALTGIGFALLLLGWLIPDTGLVTPLAVGLLVLGTAGFWVLRGLAGGAVEDA